MSQIESVFKDNFVISNMHFSQFCVPPETNHVLWLLHLLQSELKCHFAPLAVNLEGFNLAHLGDRAAVKDKATECSPLHLASVINNYLELHLNDTTSPSNEVTEEMGEQKPIWGSWEHCSTVFTASQAF